MIINVVPSKVKLKETGAELVYIYGGTKRRSDEWEKTEINLGNVITRTVNIREFSSSSARERWLYECSLQLRFIDWLINRLIIVCFTKKIKKKKKTPMKRSKLEWHWTVLDSNGQLVVLDELWIGHWYVFYYHYCLFGSCSEVTVKGGGKSVTVTPIWLIQLRCGRS